MPDPDKTIETPTTQTPATPAPETPPINTPAPETPPAAKEGPKKDDLLEVLFEDFGMSDLKPAPIPAPEKKEEPKPDDKPVETPPAPAAQPAPAPAPAAQTPPAAPSTPAPTQTPPAPAPAPAKPEVQDGPAKVEHLGVKELIEQVKSRFDTLESKLATKPPEPTKKEEPPKPPEEDLSGWGEDEIEAYELAKFAESKNPELYRGQSEKVKAFKKGYDQLIAAKSADDPDWNPATDKELNDFIAKNKPAYRGNDMQRLSRERIIEAAEERARKIVDDEKRQIQEKLLQVEMKPVVEQETAKFNRTLESYLADQTAKDTLAKVAETYQKEGIDAASKKYPLHVEAVMPIIQNAGRAASTLLSVKTGIAKFNQNDPVHQFVDGFIKSNDAWTASRPEEERTRVVEVNGRQIRQQFLPSEEFDKRKAANDPNIEQFWTWTPQAYCQMLAVHARRQAGAVAERIDQAILAYRQQFEPPQPAPQPAPAPKPDNQPPAKPQEPSPRATVSTSPGAAPSGSGAGSGTGAMSKREMEIMGMPVIS